MRSIFISALLLLILGGNTVAQSKTAVSQADQLAILKAEDELRYDKMLADFLESRIPELRKRAALAAGRIGDEDAIPALTKLLSENDPDVQQMATFAIGEIESLDGALAVLLSISKRNFSAKAKAVEALGKIAAANPNDEFSKRLGAAILDVLALEAVKRSRPDTDVILLGLTAALRAKPEGAAEVIIKFLNDSDWRVRADALNSLSRLGAKNAFEEAKDLLERDENPIVRANAARILGTEENSQVWELILNKALNDQDLRVRINSIRALGSLKKVETADKLLGRSEILLAEYKKSKYKKPIVQNELLDIANVLGNILKGSANERAIKFLQEFRKLDGIKSREIEIALLRISPANYLKTSEAIAFTKTIRFKIGKNKTNFVGWQNLSNIAQGLGELADSEEHKSEAQERIEFLVKQKDKLPPISIPEIIIAFAKFKAVELEEVLSEFLNHEDLFIRSTAANLLGDIKPETPEKAAEIYKRLSDALWAARTDKLNDASLSILDALKKQYENRLPQTIKIAYMTPFLSAIGSPDYLIRRKAAEIYRGFNIPKPDPMTVGDPAFKAYEIPKDLGVVKFNKPEISLGNSRIVRADYKSAISRENGSARAILTTDKGEFTIQFFPEEAPLTVENYIKLAKSGYFNGLEIHRVVPNFVMQDGDPRGDGNGGPGWQIRCEINQIPYERGTVGMALSGKDTGGSQWFVAHSRQPHLDGGYTVFGKVNEEGMKIVDNLVRGDKILSVMIVEDQRYKK